ncbi:MAG TPA: sensor histidine kinase KdpD [Tepidisphaeraceae bacterium]|nr:sensor histidine kinase KdpD [Tepidisphaeraceae bacterium]
MLPPQPDDYRSNPDALLTQMKQHENDRQHGRLKVFFGAAPGVGKTYAMLEEARKRAAEGVNVLIGYAEAHIRPDTEALLLGMDILRYKIVEYRGAVLKEFDLDAALAKKPQLIVIDELAHTNAPGLRHQKRWQDVGELLDAGIDVYTTLNVQHLESVNDVVERITGVAVRETLPDSVLENADEVELVDTSPEELLERLSEGKIYRRDIAQRAIHHFFNKGNLIALRELALRKTAERVDAQMQDFRRDHAVKTTWAASERILVCVSPSPLSARLVRSARRLAAGFKANWIAAYVETPRTATLSPRDRERVSQTLRLAQQLGAQCVTLSGQNIAEELVNYARAHNVTKIVIGKPQRPRWLDVLRGSVVEDLIRSSGQIDVYVIRGEADKSSPAPADLPARPVPWWDYLLATGTVAAATAVCWLMHGHFELSNLIMVYLLGVVAVATRMGRGPAILASFLSVGAFDFFFVPPQWTFAVSDTQYFVTFAVMLLVAIVISTLTHRVRQQAQAARSREKRTAALFSLSRELAATREMDNLLDAVVRQVGDLFDSQTLVLMPRDDGRLTVQARGTKTYDVDDKELGVARWVFDHDQPAGLGTATLPAARALYLPLIGSRGTVGVLGVCPASKGAFDDPEQLRLLESFANQSALAIERARLAQEASAAWERVEAEFLRNTLLSSVSHDLRTPLAAITGAASSLMQTGPALGESARRELAATIYEESERMERLINNLLDMTRLESGGVRPNKEWQPLQEVIGSALHHLDARLAGRAVKVNLPPDLPLVNIDAVAIGQVLSNLLENALQYTPAGSAIDINVSHMDKSVIVEVRDHGPGLPPGTQEQVFQKFFRAHPAGVDGAHRGIGLGLAIARGIVDAHGGCIVADNASDGGAVLRFTLPLEGAPPDLKLAER